MNYKNTKKKSVIIEFIVLFPVIMYLCFCISGLYTMQNIDITNLSEKLAFVIKNPKVSYYNSKTPGMLMAGFLFWILFFLQSYTKAMYNLMPGKEHGSAEWGNIKEINKRFADKNESNNRILSERIRVSYDPKTLLNNNTFITGGSGSGKTAAVLTPNLLNNHGSMIITDPKGSLLKKYGNFLETQENTRVYTIDLVNFSNSMRFNPFEYVRTQEDLAVLITNVIDNTNPEGETSSGDPFWDKAEKLYLTSIFSYVWQHCPTTIDWNELGSDIENDKRKYGRNLVTVLDLLHRSSIEFNPETGSRIPSQLENLFNTLDKNDDARFSYESMNVGAADTLRSIIISANSRFHNWHNEKLQYILSDNDIPISDFGIGQNGDGKSKSYLFITIRDDDKTFNFVPGMIYTVLFQELYYQARFFQNDRLPVDVGFWLDEFANIKMPSGFKEKLATVRSRGIYIVIFVQSLAQIKELFKNEAYEGVIGNCDTFIYLGGNEQGTHKYVSELLGKWTIDKKSTGETKGSNGSSSENLDVLGRDLIDPAEMRLLPNRKEIVFIRGEKPLIDDKWYPWLHKENKLAESYGQYVYTEEKKEAFINLQNNKELYSVLMSDKSIEYYSAKKEEKNMKTCEVNILNFLKYDFSSDLEEKDSDDGFINLPEELIEEIINEEEQKEHEENRKHNLKAFKSCSIIELFASEILDARRKEIVKDLYKKGIDENTIKEIVRPDREDDDMQNLYNAVIVLSE